MKFDREVLIGFVEEATSYLPKIVDGLEAYRKDRQNLDALEEAFRMFHSIKGASSMLGLTELSHVAFLAEETLEEVAGRRLEFTPKLNEHLMLALEQIETYLKGVAAGSEQDQGRLNDVAREFYLLRGRPESDAQLNIAKLTSGQFAPVSDAPDMWVDTETDIPPDDWDTPAPMTASPAPIPLDDVAEELVQAFREEAEDHFQTISRLMRRFEENPADRDAMQGIRRSVHTLKGAAGMVGFRRSGKLAHRMEDLLDGLYEGQIASTKETTDLIVATSYVLEDLVRNNEHADAEKLRVLYEEFDSLLGSTGAAAGPVAGMPAPLEKEGVIDLTAFPTVAALRTAEGPGDATTMQPSQIVRIPIERLDELVRLVSELIVGRSTFEQHYRQLIREADELKLGVARMRRIANKFETQYEAATLGKGLAVLSASAGAAETATNLTTTQPGRAHGFDELEFDRYTEFHLLSRELSEAVTDINSLGAELTSTIGDFDSYLGDIGRLTSNVQDKLMRLRMVPLASLASRLDRSVRVTASQQGKEVGLVLEGEHVELDKTVLEEMADPLLHLMRNAVDHGIEPTALRLAVGKSAKGTIRVNAYNESTQVVIEIADDGAGIDPALIREAAGRNGFAAEADIAAMSDDEVIELIFQPGFSTASEISEISGRGVGMDIVKSTVNKLKGTISVRSTPGRGTSFQIRLPMSLAVTRVIMVKANNETFALPLGVVTRILRVEQSDIEHLGNTPVLRVEGTAHPVVKLGEALNLKQPPDESVRRMPALILNLGETHIALLVEHLLEAREVVVKSLGNVLRRVRGVAGATLMGDGSVVLILNPNELVQTAARRELVGGEKPAGLAVTQRKTLDVLIVDDSVSVRRVMTNFIKNVGWNPTAAKDGVEALEMLQSGAVRPDIVLLDIEMPRMDGYELMATLRSHETFQAVPIVMLTSRAGDKHRQKALDLGASAYLVKPYQEDVLLGVVKRLTHRGN